MFELHPRLRQDCIDIGRFPLCRLLLMNESRYPWFILVPERPGLTEIYQMAAEDQTRLSRESSTLAAAVMSAFGGDKMNIAAIGNLVPQLHVHHVVRTRTDEAWPGTVWGRFDPRPYAPDGLARVYRTLLGLRPPGLHFSQP